MRTVATLCRELTADRRNDGELLAAFISHSSEEAFAELIRRHGPLVWGACRRLLPNPADAEDAFQAAFLVLVRRANRLTRTPALGPWLHRVAVWTARNVRRKNARRFARQAELPEHVTDPTTPPDTDLKADLDSALLALPSRYRDSIILCHLQGFSRREAAACLGCAEGTLSAWLHRGLAKLRGRLHAFDPKVLTVIVAVPTVLAASTVHAATACAVAAATVPPAVNSLVEGVLHMFWVKKATAASVALFATFALGIGIGVGGRSDYSGATASEGTGAGAVGEKAVPAGQPKEAPPKRDFTKEIKDLEEIIKAAEAAHKFATAGLKEAEKRLEILIKAQETHPRDILEAKFVVARFRQNAVEAAVKIEESKEKLAVLKVAQEKGQLPPLDRATQIAELEREIKRLERIKEVRVELANLASEHLKLANSLKATPAERKDATEVALTTARAVEDISNKLLSAQAKLAKLKAEEKAAPKRDDRAQLQADLLQLKKQLSAAEVEVARSKKAVETSEEQLRAAMASGKNELIVEASKKLDQARNSRAAAQAEYETLARYIPRLEEKLKAMEAEKPAKPQPPKEVPPDRDLAKEIADLEAQILSLEVVHRSILAEVEVIRARAEAIDKAKSAGKATEEEVNEAFRAHSNLVRKGEANVRELNIRKTKLAILKAEKAKADGAKLTRGHLELTVSGKASDYVFELKETDANGRIIGIITVRDTSGDVVMLARLLARTKADPTAPTELRVVAQPQTSLGYGPRAALKAANTAGYRTVKFTGYVFGGGFAQEMQPDQKGDVPGYKRYDAAERKPDELLTEIEEGLRRF